MMLELSNIGDMTYKKFKTIKIIISMILGAVIAQAVIFGNYILAVSAILAAAGITLIVKKRVKEVMADERDYQVAGKAARVSMSIFSVLGAAASFVLMAEREANPLYGTIGSVLAYSVCFLLILYSALFAYYAKQD